MMNATDVLVTLDRCRFTKLLLPSLIWIPSMSFPGGGVGSPFLHLAITSSAVRKVSMLTSGLAALYCLYTHGHNGEQVNPDIM